MQKIKSNEPTAELRRLYFFLVDASDGKTPETGEAGGQPSFSVNGDEYTNTTSTLVAIIDNGTNYGDYYVELSQEEVNVDPGSVILGRYKSANTAEGKSMPVQVDIGNQELKNIITNGFSVLTKHRG